MAWHSVWQIYPKRSTRTHTKSDFAASETKVWRVLVTCRKIASQFSIFFFFVLRVSLFSYLLLAGWVYGVKWAHPGMRDGCSWGCHLFYCVLRSNANVCIIGLRVHIAAWAVDGCGYGYVTNVIGYAPEKCTREQASWFMSPTNMKNMTDFPRCLRETIFFSLHIFNCHRQLPIVRLQNKTGVKLFHLLVTSQCLMGLVHSLRFQ